MTTNEYELVIRWDSYVAMAEALELKLAVDKANHVIKVHEGDTATEPVAYVKMERLHAWLQGYSKACEWIAAERPMIEGVPIDIREDGEIWLVFNAEGVGPSASLGLAKLVAGRHQNVVEAVSNWAARVLAKRAKTDEAE